MCIIHKFCQAIGERDSYTIEHSKKVACLMASFAKYAKLPDEEVTIAYLVGIVHDIGKVNVPDHILNKPGRLTADEFAVIKQHPEVGAALISEVAGLETVAEIVRHHHERYDGKGYGQGLVGSKIPFFSRMLAVCDTFDAMTSARCYRRKPFSVRTALSEIARCAGTQFDPAISKRFIEFIGSQQTYGAVAGAGV